MLARHTKSVVLDLSGVNLIDRDVVKFLASFETARARSLRIVRATSPNGLLQNGLNLEARAARL